MRRSFGLRRGGEHYGGSQVAHDRRSGRHHHHEKRCKNGMEHIVPLGDADIGILKALPRIKSRVETLVNDAPVQNVVEFVQKR